MADMKKWQAQNKTKYERISKNADDMLIELFNITTGPAAMVKQLKNKPDFSIYHNKKLNYSKN